jgi:hypothetical protein
VAGAGVTELLRLATGFAGVESPPLRLAFSFAEGTVRRNTLAARQRCEICGRTVVGAVKAAGTEGMLSEPQG